jgi:hypothetical protein
MLFVLLKGYSHVELRLSHHDSDQAEEINPDFDASEESNPKIPNIVRRLKASIKRGCQKADTMGGEHPLDVRKEPDVVRKLVVHASQLRVLEALVACDLGLDEREDVQ